MGFFSWDCRECGHPMLSEYATNHINNWMRDVVAVEHTGSIIKGKYDGYGMVGGHELKYGPWTDSNTCLNEPGCWHKACWELAGKPTDYKPSIMSGDQGYFFEEEHDMEQPIRPTLGLLKQVRDGLSDEGNDYLSGDELRSNMGDLVRAIDKHLDKQAKEEA